MGNLPEQSPLEFKKKPGAQVAQAVPLLPVAHPILHVHPFFPHTPFRQLQDEGGFDTAGTRHCPEPVMP